MVVQRKEHRPFPPTSDIVEDVERLKDVSISSSTEIVNFTLHNGYHVCTMCTHINQVSSAAYFNELAKL